LIEFLTKQVKSHVRVGLFFGFFFLFFNFSFGGGSSWGGFDDKSRWIGQESFGFFCSWEGDIGGCGNGDMFFESVGDAVWSRSNGWVSNVQRNGGDVVDTGHESLSDIVFGDVQNGWLENGSFVKALLDFQTVGEWRDFQHIQQSSFGSTDFVAWFEKVDIGDDFNGTSGNFGLDRQSLEETSLFWTLAGVLGWDDDVDW
jgi:hypothetical protein